MLSTVNYTPLSSHSFIQEDSTCILVRDLCNFPARFIVMIGKESVYFPLFHKASSYISMLCHSTHVFMYWMCILIWDAQLLLFMYCKSLYSAECIYEASNCSWPIEFTYDVQKCIRLSGCNAWKIIWRMCSIWTINYLHAFLMGASSAFMASVQVIRTGAENSVPVLPPCISALWKTDIRKKKIHSCWLCYLSVGSDTQRSLSLSRLIPLQSVPRAWEHSRLPIL